MKTPQQITPQKAQALLRERDTFLLDTREPEEYRLAHLRGSTLLPPSQVDAEVESILPDKSGPVIIYCASGKRSEQAGRQLLALGYKTVYNLAGGIEAWQKENLPVVSRLSPAQTSRYSRQMLLPQIGLRGQEKLLASSALVVGAGGLGSPVAFYLAAAGVGKIGIVDGDRVEASNLQRQILHTTKSIGSTKAASAKKTLHSLNPDVDVQLHAERIDRDNAFDILEGYDVVVDGSDNFATRYLLADVTQRLGQPLVSAAILGFEGQVAVFLPGGACYRCLFPEPPPPELAPSCSENGILGSVAGVVGTMEANETLKILLGVGETLEGRLLLLDLFSSRFQELSIHKNPQCPLCGPDKSAELPDYQELCRV